MKKLIVIASAFVSLTAMVSADIQAPPGSDYTATRKLGVAVADARRKVELLSRLELVRLEAPDVLAAIDLQGLHGFSFWDALIIQASLQARCTILYSEDMQPGFRLGPVQIVNPFIEAQPGGRQV